MLLDDLRPDAVAFSHQSEQDVLGADEGVVQLQRFPERKLEYFLGARRERDVPGRLGFSDADDGLDLVARAVERHSEARQSLGGESA